MFRSLFGAIAIASLIQLPAAGKTIIVRSGETLSEIAIKNKITLKRLMELNRIKNPNNIYIGQKLFIPSTKLSNNSSRVKKYHIVKEGETLGGIAKRYNMDKNNLSELNKLKNNNYLYIGQSIIVLAKKASTITNSNKIHHVVQPGETLSEISNRYQISKKNIIELNNIKDPNLLAAGSRIYLVNSKQKKDPDNPKSNLQANNQNQAKMESKVNVNLSKWRTYGPLKVDWANWQSLNGSYVTPTLHKNGKGLFLAVNCTWRQINATGSRGDWKEWSNPEQDFERQIINDRCNSTEV